MYELQATGSAEQPTVTTCGYRNQRQVAQMNKNYTKGPFCFSQLKFSFTQLKFSH
jgi:hypothetical protein